MATPRPRIGIPVDVRSVGDDTMHAVGEKYLAAVAHGAKAIPLMLPALGGGRELASLEGAIGADDLLAGLDGLFLTGSPSNMEPSRYGDASAGVGPFDPQRDRAVLSLLAAALSKDLPVLAVCRGFQELNVVQGGTLHSAVHELSGYMDHRDDHDLPREQRYEPVHTVTLTPGGFLEKLAGAHEVRVNSLHGQGLARLGEGLVADATAPDGLVEAVYMPSRRFVVGVQWHPEWKFAENPLSQSLFTAFGAAARQWMDSREQA